MNVSAETPLNGFAASFGPAAGPFSGAPIGNKLPGWFVSVIVSGTMPAKYGPGAEYVRLPGVARNVLIASRNPSTMSVVDPSPATMRSIDTPAESAAASSNVSVPAGTE